MKKIAWLFIFIPMITCSCRKTNVMTEIRLHDNWEFRNIEEEEWLPASVPGCVHTDLLANGKIEDPYWRLNEHEQQWIDKTDWEYRTIFRVSGEMLEKDRVELFFGGLDTYADVILNDTLILTADNMFREWQADVSNVLEPGENVLRICFHSPVKVGLVKLGGLGYKFPDPPNDLSEIGGLGDKKVSMFIRKAGYHFGWDWGPRFVTSGIWKEVVLRAWDVARIDNLFIQQGELSESKAELTANLEIRSTRETSLTLTGLVNGSEVLSRQVKLAAGANTIRENFTIAEPELWWPNGLGEQSLYNIKFILSNGASMGAPDRASEKSSAEAPERSSEVAPVRSSNRAPVVSEISARIGLRTIEVVQEPDKEGKSFFFRVNGRPVFMKGANYIPQDAFLDRVTPERYRHILQSAADANMNMLRVWGGGIYEKDLFYDLCDEKGILVWQDFMFACSMYPGDGPFLENVRQEAVDNVKRLRNHPCIALWCGNNECLSGWYYWKWKETTEKTQGREVADAIWKAYEDNYHRVLPEVVARYDPGKFYWSSSPSAGMGIPENRVSGDVHYWGVWWGKEPFTTYRTLKCRFMSEYGFQSFPELNTIRKFALEEDWDIFSDVMKSHQRSSIGNGTIEYYMLQDYRKPKDFPMFLYVGQVLQAEGTRVAMEGHRKNMPWCMGSLFWQIDDCWPVASWSTIDYYGNWKAQHYFARKAYRDILISPQIDGDTASVWVVSDRREDAAAKMELRLMDFDGNILWTNSSDIVVPANASRRHFTSPVPAIVPDLAQRDNILLDCSLRTVDGQQYGNILYFKPVKDLELPRPDIEWTLEGDGSGLKLVIRTDKLAKNVYLSADDPDVFFYDNYFDILPRDKVEIMIRPGPAMDKEDIESKLSLISLVDSYL